jgi:hypothetical protein
MAGKRSRAAFEFTTNILVNFVERRSLAAQAMTFDHRTMLGPQLRI